MTNLVLHPSTADSLQRIQRRQTHGVLFLGPKGTGKSAVAMLLASNLLNVDAESLDTYPYISRVAPIEGKDIPIDTVRELQHALTLKVPLRTRQANGVSRIVVIEDAHRLTTEAQNALLKTLEEPPLDTVLMLTVTDPGALLPTVRSRLSTVHVVAPDPNDLKIYFEGLGHAAADIERTLMVTGGLPGLTYAMLSGIDSHPLRAATEQARALLQGDAYQRLLLVDSLSKDKQSASDVCYILGQMSRMALIKSAGKHAAGGQRWQKVFKASYTASEQLRTNTQTKLVLTDLMLQL